MNYYTVSCVWTVPAPKAGCPHNRKLLLNRARKYRRLKESELSTALGHIELFSRFPAYVMYRPGHLLEASRVYVRTYALNANAAADAAAVMMFTRFPGTDVEIGVYGLTPWTQPGASWPPGARSQTEPLPPGRRYT